MCASCRGAAHTPTRRLGAGSEYVFQAAAAGLRQASLSRQRLGGGACRGATNRAHVRAAGLARSDRSRMRRLRPYGKGPFAAHDRIGDCGGIDAVPAACDSPPKLVQFVVAKFVHMRSPNGSASRRPVLIGSRPQISGSPGDQLPGVECHPDARDRDGDCDGSPLTAGRTPGSTRACSPRSGSRR
jgi:hypothetical protein